MTLEEKKFHMKFSGIWKDSNDVTMPTFKLNATLTCILGNTVTICIRCL